MNDPFDILRDQLVAAAGRESPVVAAPRRRRPARRALLLLAAALVVTGSATAAVVSLTGETSAPLSGTVPGSPVPSADLSRPTRSYDIGITPELRAGSVGWCTYVAGRSNGRPSWSGRGCGPAAPSDAPAIAGGVVTASPRRLISWAIVDPRVATVRLPDGRRIAPRTDPRLPFGWKAVVAFLPTERGRVSPSDLPRRFEDEDGKAIAADANALAGTTVDLPTRALDPRDPPDVPCAIRARGLPGLRAISARVVAAPLDRPADVNGRAFRSCANTIYTLDGRRFRAAVLVDAVDAGLPAAELPGAEPFRRSPGVLEAAGDITARRTGPAWLVVEGGTPGSRARVLQALRTTTQRSGPRGS